MRNLHLGNPRCNAQRVLMKPMITVPMSWRTQSQWSKETMLGSLEGCVYIDTNEIPLKSRETIDGRQIGRGVWLPASRRCTHDTPCI